MNYTDLNFAWKLVAATDAAGLVIYVLPLLGVIITIANLLLRIFFLVQFFKAKNIYDDLPG